MPRIEIIGPERATGFLKRQYEAAIKRAGRIWHIVSIMSQNPRVLKKSMDFYQVVMMGESPLSRSQREMMAVVVSAANNCVYWIRAHAHDLRAEVAADWGLTDDEAADRCVALIAADWRRAPLQPVDRALCAYAEKLTREPAAMTTADVEALRRHGLDDPAIHDATQVIAYFNYINRIADALDVELEDFIRPWEKGADSPRV